MEVGASSPGVIDRSLRLLRPTVGVVTNVGTDHVTAYGSIDGIAREKQKLVEALPPDGIAVLNADDPRVLGMAKACVVRVLTYGLESTADVRAEAVAGLWPSRLSFVLAHGEQRVPVQTQLCGAHWVSSALAAGAVGVALGIPLGEVAAALGRVQPFEGRMAPVTLPDDVTFIRDDWKASVHTIPPALAFMREAAARRKIAVIGTIADTTGDAGAVYVTMARRALEAVDMVCFVGPRASSALRAKSEPGDDRIRAFGTVKAASDFLGGVLRSGDLVLLKGSNTADHLYRIILARTGRVRCWQENCRRVRFCDTCSLLEVDSYAASTPEPPDHSVAGGPAVATASEAPSHVPGHVPSHVIVGLGNPGEQYRDTPHNIAHTVLDRLAGALRFDWEVAPEAHLARGAWKGETVCLVKPRAFMNQSGPVLVQIAQRLGIPPERCILVYDDHDLPLGSVRRRSRGSDGGHRGVRSVIEACQTDQLRRVKLGVKRSDGARSTAEAVLTPFTAEEQAVVQKACDEAIARLGDLLAEQATAGRDAR